MIRGHALYEGTYLLGTSIARPLIAKRQIAIAKKFNAYAVSHGSTGKGNDQVRFELGYHYFGPKIKIIAPWRIWKLNSRTDLIKYAKKNNIPVPKNKKGTPPFSIDDNLYHTSTEGNILENPRNQAPEFIFQRTISPEKALNKASYITIGFKNGDPKAPLKQIGKSKISGTKITFLPSKEIFSSIYASGDTKYFNSPEQREWYIKPKYENKENIQEKIL